MAATTGVWGIDVGQCALKALRLEVIDGQVTATAFDYVEHPKILSQPDADPDQLTREALETFLSRNAIKGDLIAMSIAGQSGLARFVKLPPVEEKKIADIVRFEAKQQIPFPLEEVVWDYQKISSGTVTDGFAMDTEIGLFAMKRDMISRFLHHFQGVNVEVHLVQMAPLALSNYVSYDLLKRNADGTGAAEEDDDDTPAGKRKCIVALDLGTDGSNLIITDGQKIIWQRPIPIGGNHFTRALTKEMKLTFAKAEHLKRNAAKSPDLAKILKALKPVLTDFVNEVQRSLGYFTNTHRDAHVSYMVGLGSAFRLPGLQKFLSEKLSLDVRKPTGFERMTGENVVSAPVFTENLLTFPVAYGLALQGLKQSRLTTNLLPPEIQFDRQIRAKKPYMVAAAAALLLGLGVMALGYGVKSAALGNPLDPDKSDDPVAKAMKAGKAVSSTVDTQNNTFKTRQDEVNKTTQDVQKIVAGKDERSNWIKLNEFIARCLPRPDGTNLDPRLAFQMKYVLNEDAKAAREQYDNRKLGKDNVADVPLDEKSLQNLANVDLEGMFTLYTEDLKDFFNKAKEKAKEQKINELEGIDKFFLDPPAGVKPDKKYSELTPEGPGWVIELRGYTYNKAHREFLIDTLIYNINRYGFGNGLVPFGAAAAAANPANPASAANPATPSAAKLTVADPIEGRVSHAYLYFCRQVNDPQPGQFVYINASNLRELMGGGTAAGSAPGLSAPGISSPTSPGMPTSSTGTAAGAVDPNAARASWQPLGNIAGGGGGTFGGGLASSSGPKGDERPGGAGIPAGPTGPGFPAGAPAASAPAAAAPKSRVRHEFIIYFIWREPTMEAPGK